MEPHPLHSHSRNTRYRAARPTLHPPFLPAATAAILAGLLGAACGDGQTDPDSPSPDQPAALVIHSGDGQRARAGTEADEAVRVRVTGRTGAGLEGIAVTFAVTRGGGSIPAATAVSDANGIASPGRWRLGAAGPQELRASLPGLDPVLFRATAVGAPASLAFVAGDGQEGRVGEAVAVPPEVWVTEADGAPAWGVRVFFETTGGATVERAEALTDAEGRAGPGAWTLGTATGSYTLTARVEEEGVRGNPGRVEAVALPGPAARIVAIEGEGQETEVTLPVPVSPQIQLQDSYENPIPNLRIAFSASGDSQVIPSVRATDSLGLARVDRWVLGTTAGVTYRLTVRLANDGGGVAPVEVAIAARAQEADYDIEIVHVASSLLTEAERAIFDRARAFWESAIRGDQAWSTLRKPSLERCFRRNNLDDAIPDERIADDLVIYATIREIDGPGGVLAGAGPCLIRESNSLPVAGVMVFDRSDTGNRESFEGTVLHEMAHVIGFGTLWTHLELLDDSASFGRSANTHFRGAAAERAFAEIGGERYPGSTLVPVQNLGGPGVWNGHWRELVFYNELMTPFPDRGRNPVSIVTLASFVDIGYEGVDPGVADDYAIPFAGAGAGRIVAGAGAERLTPHPAHGHELLYEPFAVIDREGRIVRRVPGAHPPGPAHRRGSFRR